MEPQRAVGWCLVDREHTMVGWRLSHCRDSNSWQLCSRDCEWWGFDDGDAESASKTSSVPPHTGTAECMVTWTCRVTLEDETFRLLRTKQRVLPSALIDLPLSLLRISLLLSYRFYQHSAFLSVILSSLWLDT